MTTGILSPLLSESLSKFFTNIGIDVVEHRNKDHLIQNFNTDESVTYFIIINSQRNEKLLIDQIHGYGNVHSIYFRCEAPTKKYQKRLARNYSKLDGVFDDPMRLLIKTLMDLGLFCEEVADRQADDPQSIKEAKCNYQRSIDLYSFAETLVSI